MLNKGLLVEATYRRFLVVHTRKSRAGVMYHVVQELSGGTHQKGSDRRDIGAFLWHTPEKVVQA